MQSKIILPTENQLKPYIEYFWYMKSDLSESADCTILPPETSFDMVFCLADNPFWINQKHQSFQLTDSFITGMRQESYTMQCQKPVEYLAVRFFPYGLYPFLGIPLSEIAEHPIFSLDLFPKNQFSSLNDQFGNIPDLPTKIRVLEKELCLMLKQQSKTPSKIVNTSLAYIHNANGSLSIQSLNQKLDIYSRRLEREFAKYIGIPPKTYSRVLRFNNILNYIQNNPSKTSWQDIVYKFGYFDQSHMIKDFIEFTGFSPEQYQAVLHSNSDVSHN
ncbi:DUF6597 domain-containing transcriptional factor [bacterium]